MVSVLEHAGVFTAGLIGLCALACGLMQLSVSRWWRGPPSNAAGRVVNGPPLLQADYEQQTQQQQQQQQQKQAQHQFQQQHGLQPQLLFAATPGAE